MEKYLISRFSMRSLFFFAHFFYAICMGVLYFQSNIYIIMPLSSSLGVILTANVTIPYQMISEFHNDKVYKSKSAPGTKRGIGLLYFYEYVFSNAKFSKGFFNFFRQ